MKKKILLSLVVPMTAVGLAFAEEPVPGIVVTCPDATLYYKLADAPRVRHIEKDGVTYAALFLNDDKAPAYTVLMQDGKTMKIGFGDYDDPQVNEVIGKIDDIGTVEYSDECKARVEDARTAYDALNDYQKKQITNYQTLLDAESPFACTLLKRIEAYEQKIAEIPTGVGVFQYTPAVRDRLDAAILKAELQIFGATGYIEQKMAYDDFKKAAAKYTVTLPKANDFFTFQDVASGLYLNIEGENVVLSETPSLVQLHATGEEPMPNPDFNWVKSEYYIYSTPSRKYVGVDGSEIALTTAALHPFQIEAKKGNEWTIGLEGEDQLGTDASKRVVAGAAGMKWFIAYAEAPSAEVETPDTDNSEAEATSISKIAAEKTNGKYIVNGKVVIVKNGRKYNSNGVINK